MENKMLKFAGCPTNRETIANFPTKMDKMLYKGIINYEYERQ